MIITTLLLPLKHIPFSFIFASRCVWTSGLCWLLSRELSQKGLNGVGKEKSFMQKSGTKRSLFRLWLRLLHPMLDCVLIVCLVIFAVAWLVSNDWACLMSLWKHHALFLLFGSINLVFSFDALFGLTWYMLTPCWLQNKSPIASMIILFLTCDTTLCFFHDALLLCMIMAIIALLVGRSQSFASPHFVLSMSSTRASNSQKPSLPLCPL
jgi:hypothetical protein